MEKKRNLWVIPTDKPSRLHYYNHIDLLGLSKEYLKWKQGYNIYITSDEEIKEGDWYASFIVDEKTKWETTKLDCVVKADLNKTNEYLVEPFSKYCKKIILTTDQDLIADGVQAIDDEFLEWFAKNLSCEVVEVNWVKTPDGIFYHQENVPYGCYKIIIPKEELTKDEIDKFFVDMVCNPKEPKQETLEEAANKAYCFYGDVELREAFELGAKWQQERSYSEEEVLKIIQDCKSYLSFGDEFDEIEWFNKRFKKK